MLDNIKKQLKMEALLASESADIMQKYKYYAFLLDMFKYGIMTDELRRIMTKSTDIQLTECALNTLNTHFRDSKDEIVEVPIIIDLIDDFSIYDVNAENVFEVVVTPEMTINTYYRCLMMDCKFDKEVSGLIRGASLSVQHAAIPNGMSLSSTIMPTKIVKNIVNSVIEELNRNNVKPTEITLRFTILVAEIGDTEYTVEFEEFKKNYDDEKNLLYYIYGGK